MPLTTKEVFHMYSRALVECSLPEGMQSSTDEMRKSMQLLYRHTPYSTFKSVARDIVCVLGKLTDEHLRESYKQALCNNDLSSAQVCLKILTNKSKMFSETPVVLRDRTNENNSSLLSKMNEVAGSSKEIGSSVHRNTLEPSLKQCTSSGTVESGTEKRITSFSNKYPNKNSRLESIEESESSSDSESKPPLKCSSKSNKGHSVDGTHRLKSAKSVQSKTQPLKHHKYHEQSESEDSEQLFRPSNNKRNYSPPKTKGSRPKKNVKRYQETESDYESEKSVRHHRVDSKHIRAEKHLDKTRSKRNHYRRQSVTDKDSSSDEDSTSTEENDVDVKRRNYKKVSLSHNRKRVYEKIVSPNNDVSSRNNRTERSRPKTKVNRSSSSSGSSASPQPCPKTNPKKHATKIPYSDSEDNVNASSTNKSSKNPKKTLSTFQSTSAKKNKKAPIKKSPSSKTQINCIVAKSKSKKTSEASKKTPKTSRDISSKAVVNSSQFLNCLKELESSFLKGKPDPLAASKSNEMKKGKVKSPSINQTSNIKKGSKVTNNKCGSAFKPSDKKKRESLAKVNKSQTKQATKPRSKRIKKTGAVKNNSDNKTNKRTAQKKKVESEKPKTQKKEVKPKVKENVNKKKTKGAGGTAKSTEKDTKQDEGAEKSGVELENSQKNTSLSSDESFLSDSELEPKLGSLSSCLNSIKKKLPRPLGSATPPLNVFLSATNDGALSETSETSSFDRIPTKLDDKNVVKRMARANKPNHEDALTSRLTSSESKQILKTPQSLKRIMKIKGKVKSQESDIECSSFTDD